MIAVRALVSPLFGHAGFAPLVFGYYPEMEASVNPRERCGRFFNAWKDQLQWEPGYWMIRDLASGLSWRNGFLGTGMPEMAECMPWTQRAEQFIHAEDIHKLEDHHSLALKTRLVAVCCFRVKEWRGDFMPMTGVIRALFCPGCQHRCALNVIRLRLDQIQLEFGLNLLS
jgi:hypothetical protein